MFGRLVSSSALLAGFIDYAVFRGFLGLLETMSVEDVVCRVPSEELQGRGCSAANGASIEIVAVEDEAPLAASTLTWCFRLATARTPRWKSRAASS
ncbi:hypothetical protein [Pyrodictium abyssi]|uniref:Uncharacterized protein n=1 Tax=Pyrodictium abyssi TaxID=54256 RepID=A0ABM8J102_9CREN|nr:hypothetical protein PABY_23090 [Pyrodictium abyssi]